MTTTRNASRLQPPRNAGDAEHCTRPASELPDIVSALPGFTQQELWQPGSRLKPGATYLDLRALRGGPFSAPLEAYAGAAAGYVAQTDVPPLRVKPFTLATLGLRSTELRS